MKERRKTSAAEFNAERPYERMDAMGADKLTDAELIAILIHSGDGSGDATAISRRLLNGNNPQNPPSLGILCGMSFKDLMKIRGIGKVKARRILALMELSIRLAQVRHEKGLIFNDPQKVFDYYRPRLAPEDREKLLLISLNLKLEKIGEHVLSSGTINATLISVREVFERALSDKATSILLIHNHPSGDPTPSRCDGESTERIAKAGLLLGIPLIDHIIVGNSYYSFMEDGRIDCSPKLYPGQIGEFIS